jgi:uncharacterized protein
MKPAIQSSPVHMNVRKAIIPITIFALIVIFSMSYAKWYPYFFKVIHVSSTHSLGSSIITGKSANAPAVGWHAAIGYTVAYVKSIWVALIAGLLIGSGVQTLLPSKWLFRVLGRTGWKSSTLATVAAVPSMMCTCCSAPIVVSLKKRNVSTGAVIAYWLANPILNPATIIFMGFVLGWNWAVLRIVMGIMLVAGAITIINHFGSEKVNQEKLEELVIDNEVNDAADTNSLFIRYIKVLTKMALSLIPEYIIIIFLLGAVRAWFFPAMSPAIGHSLWLMLILAITGTLFAIPTAGEIPIIQALLSYGLGTASAGTLLMALPAVSLPSLAMVGQAVSHKDLVKITVFVAAVGLVSGLAAYLFI